MLGIQVCRPEIAKGLVLSLERLAIVSSPLPGTSSCRDPSAKLRPLSRGLVRIAGQRYDEFDRAEPRDARAVGVGERMIENVIDANVVEDHYTAQRYEDQKVRVCACMCVLCMSCHLSPPQVPPHSLQLDSGQKPRNQTWSKPCTSVPVCADKHRNGSWYRETVAYT